MPKPVRDAAEVALHGLDNAAVLCAGASAAVDSSGEAEQQDGQGAAAAQQLQPLAAKELPVLQRHACERALRQHGAQQRVVLHNARRHAAAADDEKSGCGAERTRQGAVRLRGSCREGSCSGALLRNTRRARGTFRLRERTRRTRKNSSTGVQSPSATTSLGGSGSPSPCHAACATQAEGEWSRRSVVSLGLCRMQATRRHAAATGALLFSWEAA